MSSDILDYFPLEKIRPVQQQALLEVHAAFESGKKFVILEAPPGVGKSSLAVTLARYYRSAYILTQTKQLQAQYAKDFADARELKGRGNFECARVADVGGGTCDTGGERKLCLPKNCPYRLAKAAAVTSDLTICNYMSYLYSVGTTSYADAAMHAPPWPSDADAWKRPLLVLDECHGAEEVMLDYISITVDGSKLRMIDLPFPQAGSVDGAFAWLELFAQILPEEYAELTTPKEKKTIDRLQRRARFALERRNTEDWICETLDSGKIGFCLKPLTVRTFAKRLFEFGDRVLLMSATVLDAGKMAHDLGIEDYASVSVPCPFPVENRPVTCFGLNMTKAHRPRSWPAMVEICSSILDMHGLEKGLILCPSNEMVDFLAKELPKGQSARLISARGKTRLIDYQRHLDSKEPSVLIAAGFWEGADLKGDYSRFQILPAIPRPYWGGQIAARAQIDPLWYRLQGAMQLVQGVGRSVRSETDTAQTYVLDKALREEAERFDTLLPGWFREALVYA